MRTPFTHVLLSAVFCLTACDRGAKLYEQAGQEEKSGSTDDARSHYLAVTQQFQDSAKADDARAAFVRLSLDMAEKATADGDFDGAEKLLGQSQPSLADGDRSRFQGLQQGNRDARLAKKEMEAARKALEDLIGALKSGSNADAWLIPDSPATLRSRFQTAKSGTPLNFSLGEGKRAEQGRYVFAVSVVAEPQSKAGEWFVQATPYGWKIVCARDAGDTLCADPWVYKKVPNAE